MYIANCNHFLARDVIYTLCLKKTAPLRQVYISRLCYDVSVRLSVRLSVTEVHWRIIIANRVFQYYAEWAVVLQVSNSDPNLPRIVIAAHNARSACGRIVVSVHTGKRGGIIPR